jgi:chorismate-pyruvate lyase
VPRSDPEFPVGLFDVQDFMSVSQPQPVIDAAAGKAVLSELCGPFDGEFNPECQIVQPENIPHPEDDLLVHHDHMTVVLERHHGRPVQVHVLEERIEGDFYRRKISLTPEGSNKIVELGVVRLDLRYMPEEVSREIRQKKTPLGAILIKHKVHRRVKPRYFLRVPPGSAVVKLFGTDTAEPVYGRLGTIYCDRQPCIELLEIVLNVEKL